jgi:hypothetical protein
MVKTAMSVGPAHGSLALPLVSALASGQPITC